MAKTTPQKEKAAPSVPSVGGKGGKGGRGVPSGKKKMSKSAKAGNHIFICFHKNMNNSVEFDISNTVYTLISCRHYLSLC